MKKTDMRVQFTKTVLQNALLDLLKEMPISRITVKALVDRAGVNRGTFYLHYGDPEELLSEIQHNYLKTHMEMFENYWERDHPRNMLESIMHAMDQDREVSLVLFGPNGNPWFLRNIREMAREQTLEGWKKELQVADGDYLQDAYNYIFDGSMRLILDRMEDDHGVPYQTFARRLERFAHGTLSVIQEEAEAEQR